METEKRIREECSVDYNLSPQITEVLKNEWLARYMDLNGFLPSDIRSYEIELLDKQSDWWLSKIAELLKSQEHKLREELVEKGEELNRHKFMTPDKESREMGYFQAIKDYQSLIKEDN